MVSRRETDPMRERRMEQIAERVREHRERVEADASAAIEAVIRAEPAIVRAGQGRIDRQVRRMARAKRGDAGPTGRDPVPSAR